MTITHERNCDNCIHFRWYYDLCKKFGIEVDGREVHDCFEEKTNERRQSSMEKFNHEVPTLSTPCRYCANHPSNGGNGICHCTLGTLEVR